MSKKQKSRPSKNGVILPEVFQNLDEETIKNKYARIVESVRPSVDNSRQEPEPSLNTEIQQEEEELNVLKNQLHVKEKSEQEPTLYSDVMSDNSEKSLWNDFMLFAEESRKAIKKKEAQVWINEDLKIILERIRCAGVRLPIKHLMNGILKAFLTANQKDIEKLLRQKIKL